MLKAFGVYCGIGSMLIGAKQAGFRVIGNIESRLIYEKENFLSNFPGADWNEVHNADLCMGHPSCSNYSVFTLSAKHFIKSMEDKRKDPGLFLDFVDAVGNLQPKFFVLENLPKSLAAFPIEFWVNQLGGDYDLTPEIVSNYHYGNVQKSKVRMFIIGAHRKKAEGFRFIAGETNQFKTVKDVIGDLPFYEDLPEINHIHVNPEELCGLAFGYTDHKKNPKKTFREIGEILRKLPLGETPAYLNEAREVKHKLGLCAVNWDGPSKTITGGGFRKIYTKYHPKTFQPLTIREILRIQGAPDWFRLTTKGERKGVYITNPHIMQVGKFISVEFCRYLCKQIKSFLEGKKQPAEVRHYLPKPAILKIINPARKACGKEPYK